MNDVGTPAAVAAAESFLVRDRLPVDLTHRPDPDQSSVPPFVIPDQLSPTALCSLEDPDIFPTAVCLRRQSILESGQASK